MSTVAVTGVGAIIGYGLLRSFRASGRPLQLVGCDIYPDAVGQAWCDVFEQAPPTASDSYLDWLEALLRRHRVTLLVPGIEQDVQRFAAARQRLEACGCRVALNDAALIELASDKWAMHEALARIDDAVRIPSRLDGSFDQLSAEFGLPFILKPRRSYASKGLVRVSGRESFEPHRRLLGEALMAQPIVGSDEEEYTVGVFGDGAGGIAASITLRRRLAADGSTAKAWVRQEPSLAPTVARLCASFRPLGPTNLQFRRAGRHWKLLEINPRVSSSSSIRTAFGYNEAAMLLDYYLEGRLPAQPLVGSGFAARYIEDFVVHDRDHF